MTAMPIGGTNPATPGIPIEENLTRKGITLLYIIFLGVSIVLNLADDAGFKKVIDAIN
jgi:hypothetical protein